MHTEDEATEDSMFYVGRMGGTSRSISRFTHRVKVSAVLGKRKLSISTGWAICLLLYTNGGLESTPQFNFLGLEKIFSFC